MGFRLKSGNTTSFKLMGGTDKSPAKHFVDDVPEHNDGHPNDLQSPEEHEAWREENVKPETSPAKQYVNPSDRKKETPGQYWYKINNKPVTKTEYIKYQNKPGGDEPGKQTNDPTVSLAKQSVDKRTKINK